MKPKNDRPTLAAIVNRLKTRLGQPARRWDWLQVEVSSQCNAACSYCPTALYRSEGSNLLLPLETYRKLAPAFPLAQMVYLQGWGEPFLNLDFFEMVRLAKAAGCRVGTTTNGTLLDGDRLAEMVRSGVDIAAFSLAGCPENNDRFRKGTCLEQVLDVIRQLTALKAKLGVQSPEIHVAYQLLRSGLDDVGRLPEMLAGLGIAQVVISTLEFVPLPALASEALDCGSAEEYRSFRARLDALVEAGKPYGLDIHYQVIAPPDEDGEPDGSGAGQAAEWTVFLPEERPACPENIHKAVFINSGGEVTACVFNSLPVRSAEEAEALSGRPYHPIVFGNLRDQSLEDIWDSPAYRDFRRSHRAGRLEGNCLGCTKTRVRT